VNLPKVIELLSPNKGSVGYSRIDLDSLVGFNMIDKTLHANAVDTSIATTVKTP